MTPEGKVKAKVKKLLDERKAYYFMPVTGGYGSSGVPDIVCLYKGRFIGIECKANGNKPTALQHKNLDLIEKHGGSSWVVDETNIDLFAEWLERI